MTAASKDRKGDTLVLGGVVASTTAAGASARVPMGEVNLRDRGDGSVEVKIAPKIDIEVDAEAVDPTTPPIKLKMAMEQKGYVAVVSGSKETPVIEMNADSVTLRQERVDLPENEGAFESEFTLNQIEGRAELKTGEATEVAYNLKAAGLQAKGGGSHGKEGGAIDIAFEAQNFTSVFEGTLPAGMANTQELHEVISAGLRGKGSYESGPGKLDVVVRDKGQDTKFNLTMESTSLNAGLEATGIDYGVGAKGLAASFSGPAVPLPEFKVTASEYQLGLRMPLIKTEAPTDFGAVVRLTDLVLPDFAWMMFDPSGSLPREAASLIVDLSGKVRLTQNISSDPEDNLSEEMPGEIHAININELLLKLVGAELTGAGGFTFDNTDMETFEGFPRPMGSVDFRLVGGNKLIDQLVALGLIGEDEVMGYRMMLAMFTKAGEGEDVLTSKIEVTPEGNVIANGQRIQ